MNSILIQILKIIQKSFKPIKILSSTYSTEAIFPSHHPSSPANLSQSFDTKDMKILQSSLLWIFRPPSCHHHEHHTKCNSLCNDLVNDRLAQDEGYMCDTCTAERNNDKLELFLVTCRLFFTQQQLHVRCIKSMP